MIYNMLTKKYKSVGTRLF